MNELLIRYLEMQLAYIDQLPNLKERFYHNAFGAVDWESFRQPDPKKCHEIIDEWEKVWQPRFIKKVWGE